MNIDGLGRGARVESATYSSDEIDVLMASFMINPENEVDASMKPQVKGKLYLKFGVCIKDAVEGFFCLVEKLLHPRDTRRHVLVNVHGGLVLARVPHAQRRQTLEVAL